MSKKDQTSFGVGKAGSLYENVNDASNSNAQWFGLDDCVGKKKRPAEKVVRFLPPFLSHPLTFPLNTHIQAASFGYLFRTTP